MKDDGSDISHGDTTIWFTDQAKLLEEVRGTAEHWGHLPEIQGYDHLVEIQRGGQGVVYRARQCSTDRTVAIKVLLDGMYAPESSRMRFEREIKFIAHMKHPNIVPIYDSGVTADGHLYCVMEYVFGVPINHSDLSLDRDLRKLLDVFLVICEAVHYAHQRGIIHRDLKPKNILIDDRHEPRILDFGLAKIAADFAPTVEVENTLSRTGQFLGSLAWASPEQLEGALDRIDVRSDVYSLGVMLYQLVVGRLPHQPSENLRETLNEIANETPPRPRSIRRDLPDDVETIILRCLAKEPDRRYQTVAELANDIRRFLNGDAIDAKRDNKWYVFRKTLIRHRNVTLFGVLLVVSILAFATTMAVLYQRTAQAERTAQENLEIAKRETAKTMAVRQFLEQMLGSANPLNSMDHSMTVGEMLSSAAVQIEDQFSEYPEIEAEIRSVIGSAYHALGFLEEAEEQERHSLEIRRSIYGDDHVETATGLVRLGSTVLVQRRFQEAEPMLHEALAIALDQNEKDEVLIADCYLVLASLRHGELQFEDAESYFSRAYDLSNEAAGPHDDRTILALMLWADLLVNMRDFDTAMTRIELALQRIRERSPGLDPLLSHALQSSALVKMYRREFDAALEALEEAANDQLAIFGDAHPRLADIYNLMGDVLREQGDYAEAESRHADALEVCERRIGRESPEGARCLWAMGQARWRTGDRDGAEALMKEAIEIRRRLYDPNHHLVTMSVFQLGKMNCEVGRHENGRALLKEASQLMSESLGSDHPLTMSAVTQYAMCLAHLDQFVECENVLLAHWNTLASSLEEGDSRRARLLQALVDLYMMWGRPEAAVEYQNLLPDLPEEPGTGP